MSRSVIPLGALEKTASKTSGGAPPLTAKDASPWSTKIDDERDGRRAQQALDLAVASARASGQTVPCVQEPTKFDDELATTEELVGAMLACRFRCPAFVACRQWVTDVGSTSGVVAGQVLAWGLPEMKNQADTVVGATPRARVLTGTEIKVGSNGPAAVRIVRAYLAIREGILNGTWTTALPQVTELSQVVGYAPTYVRRGLARLAAEGMVRAGCIDRVRCWVVVIPT
jgi:hypothetical protein